MGMATELGVGAGGLVLGLGAGVGLAMLGSDGNPKDMTGFEGTMVGLGGFAAMGSFAAMPALGDVTGRKAALALGGIGASLGFFGGMAAASVFLNSADGPKASKGYDGIVARNTTAGALFGGVLGAGAVTGYHLGLNGSMGRGAMLVAVLAAAGGAALIGNIAHNAATGSIAAREEARIGEDVDELAKDYIWMRDDDEDGRIDVPAESRTQPYEDTDWVERDGIQAKRIETVYTSYADVDRVLNGSSPGDDISWQDVAAAMGRYDVDATGGLSEAEQAAFDAWEDEATEVHVQSSNFED